jgi:ArsR family metal-binding transcriptional regulator
MSNGSEPTDLLIHGYRLELFEIPCIPGAAAWNAKAFLDDCISAVLPYLNAQWKGTDYHHDLETLIWKTEGRKVALRPHEIAVAPVEDREEASRLIENMVGVVNAIWRRRADIRPSFARRRLPGLMDIYKLLPRTNCKECGYSSCMAYAGQLREGKAELSQCPYLPDDSCATIRHQLSQVLGDVEGSGQAPV